MKIKFLIMIKVAILLFFLIVNVKCSNKENYKKVTNNEFVIDTTFQLNKRNFNLKISAVQDSKYSIIQNGNYDASELDAIEDDDEYWVNFSTSFKIEILDKKNKFGKSFAFINIDLLKAFINKYPDINKNIGSLNESLLDSKIEFLGLTKKGLAMFKLYSFVEDDGGQEWVIGMEINQSEWAENFHGIKERHMPICLIEVKNNSGEDFHFQNDKYLLGDFIGSWNFDCSNGGFENLEIVKNEKYIHFPIISNQIYLNARYELKSEKLLLFLNYETGIEFGDFGSGGASLPWDDYSREKPIAEILSKTNQPDKINIIWHGFYNINSKKYEQAPPEFMSNNDENVKSALLKRCI